MSSGLNRRAIVSLSLAIMLYFAPSEARALKDPELYRSKERVLDSSAAAGRVIILDNSLLSNGWRRSLDYGDQIAPNESLTHAIRSGMTARTIAGLRIAESGRKLLEEGDYARALMRFERSLALDATPYSYYYLALIHYRLGRYQQAHNFIEVAESRLHDHFAWMTELARLRNAVGRASRSSQMDHDPAAMTKTAARSASEAEPQRGMKTAAAENDGVRYRYGHYLLLFDFLLLSLSAFVFLAALSSLNTLRPR
jgi:tetratricopeptide (TPR) repeat protein